MTENFPHTLIITIEHSDTGKMGGIGSYNSETDKLADGNLFLLIDDDIDKSPKENIILCHKFIDDKMPQLKKTYNSGVFGRSYAIFLVAKEIINSNPSIQKVSTHEYSGLGMVTAQAFRMGLMNDGLTIRTHCHGGHVQLYRATDSWQDVDLEVLDAERLTIENSDNIYFASKYLHDLYRASGMRLDSDRVKFLKFPYDIKNIDESIEYSQIKNVVFIGRTNLLKGFDIFTKVVQNLINDKSTSALKRVLVFGKDDGSMAFERDAMKGLLRENGITYEQSLKSREDLLSEVESLAPNSLFILPYYSDNFSVAMLEIVEAGGPLLVLDTGGNKELIDSPYWRKWVASSDTDLNKKVKDFVLMDPVERKKECMAVRHDFAKELIRVNKDNLELYSRDDDASPRTIISLINTDYASKNVVLISVDDNKEAKNDGIWIDSLTGKIAGGEVEDDSVYILHPSTWLVDAKNLFDDALVLNSVKSISEGSIISFPYEDKDGIVKIPNSYSVGQAVFRWSDNHTYIVAINGKKLKRFLEKYSNPPAGVATDERKINSFFTSLLYDVLGSGGKMNMMPVVAATEAVEMTVLNREKNIFDSMHYLDEPDWNGYCHAALVRNRVIRVGTPNISVVDEETDSTLRSDSRSAAYLRKIVHYQVRFLTAALRMFRR